MKTLRDFLSANAGADISKILLRISETCLEVSRRLPLAGSGEGGINPSGERQTAIDLFANDAFVRGLLLSGEVAEVASEEMERPRLGRGRVHVSMDPLDGSSNISTNNPLGSIFGFYTSPLPCSGESMIAAAYVTYGPMLTLTLTCGKGVQRFAGVDQGRRKRFVLLSEDLKIPERGEIFGFGGLRREWIAPVERFVASLEGRGMKLRYGGTFVGDFNQVMEYGGIFAYPALRNKPRGKLRILYEAAPIAFIAKQAGGYASDGRSDILSIGPSQLAETAPLYVGSKPLVRELERRLQQRS